MVKHKKFDAKASLNSDGYNIKESSYFEKQIIRLFTSMDEMASRRGEKC